MPESLETKQQNSAKLNLVNGVEAAAYYNAKTGEVGTLDRTYWLETRGVMVVFALLFLTVGILVTIGLSYVRFEEASLGALWNPLSWFWFIATLSGIWLGFIGGLTLEYGIRKRQIAHLKGQQLSFMVGGPSFIFGVICIVCTLCVTFGILYLSTANEAPYNALIDDMWTPVVFSMVTPLITLLGGFLFAKAIRGKDRLAKAFA